MDGRHAALQPPASPCRFPRFRQNRVIHLDDILREPWRIQRRGLQASHTLNATLQESTETIQFTVWARELEPPASSKSTPWAASIFRLDPTERGAAIGP